MLVTVVTSQTMKSSKEWFKGGQNCHPLTHRQLAFRVYQVSSTAHIKLARLGVFMDFIEIGILEHKLLLRLLPVKVVPVDMLMTVKYNSQCDLVLEIFSQLSIVILMVH